MSFGVDLNYDGIIYQQAGELLLDIPETRSLRWRCANSYRVSLNSFVFGQVLGRYLLTFGVYSDGKLITSPMVPLYVAGPPPGERLLTEHFSQKRRPLPPSQRDISAATLVADPLDSGRIKAALARLADIVTSERGFFWAEHAVREVYLTFKPKGGEWHKENGLWQFDGRENFYPNEEKEAAVPTTYIQYVDSFVRNALPRTLDERSAPDGALQGYLRRNVVAHIAIHPTSNLNANPASDPGSSARVMHTTRASLASAEVEEQLWNIQELTVPGLLQRMVIKAAREGNAVTRRQALIKEIQDAADDPKLEGMRTTLSEAVMLAGRGELQLLKTIISDLHSIISERDETPETSCLYRGTTLYEKALSALEIMGAAPNRVAWTPEFLRAWFDVFPELRPPDAPET